MLKFDKNVDDRKDLVKRLGELTGIQPVYMRTPTYAFKCGDYTVDREGCLLIDEEKADAEVLTALMSEGFITGGEVVDTEELPEVETIAETREETAAEEGSGEQAEAVEQPEAEAEEPAEQPEAEDQEEPVEAAEPETQETVQEEAPEADESLEIDEEAENEDGIDLNMAFPIEASRHSGTSLRNLVNLIYSRGGLINKATDGHFHVEEGLIEALKDDACTFSTANFRKAVADYESQHGRSIHGLTITPEQVTFTGFGKADDVTQLEAYGHLAIMMNEQAISQKRIQAKHVDDSNEKYAMRIWMVRIGMGGDEFKKTRAVVMKKLEGHTAFRTPEEAERAKVKAQQKRDALKAAKAAAQAEENGEV